MLLSAFIITVLYLLVALVLFGILVVDGSKWRLRAPPRSVSGGIRDFFGQFSWGRLVRPSQPSGVTHSQSVSVSSGGNGGIKSTVFHSHAHTGSIRLASVGRRSNDIGVGSTNDAIINVALPPADKRPDTGSTVNTDILERGRSSTSKKIGIKHSAAPSTGGNNAAHAQTQMSLGPNSANGRSLQLRALAIKMLWYPIVYLVLILPIAISRVDSRVKVSLDVMLGFMCLLWLMGTANTIIYVCTRRLGPTPWSRKMSISRTRSRSAHTGAGGNNAFGGVKTVDGVATHISTAPVQIFVDRYTHRATDDQLLEIGREKGSASGSSITGADIPVVVAASPASDTTTEPVWSPAGALERPRDSKVGFDFGSMPAHTPRRASYGRSTYSSTMRSPSTGASTLVSPLHPPPSTTIDDPQQLPQVYTIPLQPRSSSPPPFSQPSIIPSSQYTTTTVTTANGGNVLSSTTVMTPSDSPYEEPHPYSRAQSPRHESHASSSSSNVFRSMSVRSKPQSAHAMYFMEDDDESLRIGRNNSRSSTTRRAY
ncbi:hypothetical protein FRC17_007229 [Serendipita sp. 399]|nr:hypothetical protein FRC17_007229 [Serendipita sp. 399]